MISNNNKDISIHFAEEKEAGIILSFIKELAEYEKLTHEVVATEEKLKETLFGEKKYAEVLIAEYKNQPAGFALFFHNYSTFLAKPGIYLEDLFVKKELRGKGIGKVLLSYLGVIALERNCGRIEWSVLDWNEPSIKFYLKLGAIPLNDWTVYRVTGNSIKKLADEFYK
ncbi:GNAT family N-acetyltransferase [Stygiobacter electus]|uniref:GNAT family N-acetyltransferase n=1 Tax=Stygiobacter electus TaxID=3032292 RepID=A0AAE3NWJ2_9BACT|nr:GNAT family N-acetyltransferase [Stygiobacter electus]MDF1612251.1 GNAT family N-acetyltransferase [Stygiobacter electus]